MYWTAIKWSQIQDWQGADPQLFAVHTPFWKQTWQVNFLYIIYIYMCVLIYIYMCIYICKYIYIDIYTTYVYIDVSLPRLITGVYKKHNALILTHDYWLVVWEMFFFHIFGISSSQLTNSYFSEGLKPPTRFSIWLALSLWMLLTASAMVNRTGGPSAQ